MGALYIKQKPIVVLEKYRQDLEESEILLEKLIEGKISKNRFVGRDHEVQVRDEAVQTQVFPAQAPSKITLVAQTQTI